MDEFEIIERYFRPLTNGYGGCADLCDDAAVLDIPDGYEVVVTSDTLNEGVHFMRGEAPENIACKALRVNLSDLASMGARPFSYQLNIAFPDKPIDEDWISAFTGALAKDNAKFHVFCSGGDTTRIHADCLSISITAIGVVPKGQAVRRNGAKDGDVIIMTGPVGDAALGLKALQEGLDPKLYSNAITRHRVPVPRVGIEEVVRQYAHAAADISDGLLADCMNIARASGLGVEIDMQKFEFSKDVQYGLENNAISYEEILCGGDDYELILAVKESSVNVLLEELQENKLNQLVIGRFTDSKVGFRVLNSGSHRIDFKSLGWKHF